MINNKIYQKIYDEVEKFLPAKWVKLVIYLEYGEASYSFSFYVQEETEYVKCFDLPGVSEDELMISFKEINKIVSRERELSKDLWSNMTMVVKADGQMHTDFSYDDLSKGNYQYKKSWKLRYLN